MPFIYFTYPILRTIGIDFNAEYVTECYFIFICNYCEGLWSHCWWIGIVARSGWNLVAKILTAGKVIVSYPSIRAYVFFSIFENLPKIKFFEFYYKIGRK